MQRGRACKGGSEVGRGYRNLPTAVFRVVRARSAWGEEPEKVSRPLLAARRRATLRVQGAPGRVSSRRGGGVRHGIRRGRRDLPGMGCGPSAVAGLPRGLATTSWRGRRRAPESRRFGLKRDGVSRAACGGYAHGIAGGEVVLRMERLRCCATRLLRERGRRCWATKRSWSASSSSTRWQMQGACEGPGPAARVHGARRPAGPSRRRGHTGPEVDKREMRRAHRRGRAHPGDAERGLLCRGARACSQRRPSKRNAPLSAGKPSRCPPRLFDSGRRPELGAPLISLAR